MVTPLKSDGVLPLLSRSSSLPMVFLAYDVRGIQSFITLAPRLRYMVGGSALVDRFDHVIVPEIAEDTAELVFSGGGKGILECTDASVDGLVRDLVTKAHEFGLDLRVGSSEDYSQAARSADRLYPFMPSGRDLVGHPCEESGAYPLGEDGGAHWRGEESGRPVAPVLLKRLEALYHENTLDGKLLELSGLEDHWFFTDVDPATDEGDAAMSALGRRNRWAIVAMDGNGMGEQFTPDEDAPSDSSGGRRRAWATRFGRELHALTLEACAAGIRAVVDVWKRGPDSPAGQGDLPSLLPLRPLVVGGDDIVVLCHAAHAMEFVKAVTDAFSSGSKARHREAARDGIDLWPATGGEISISAGVLFAPVALPLATGIHYAEALLGLAKERGRELRTGKGPAPACVDWESVTEGLLDHPAVRRRRELRFCDGDDGDRVIELTRRPYSVDRLRQLEAASGALLGGAGGEAESATGSVPRSIALGLRTSLRAGLHDRALVVARLAKNHLGLARLLDEEKGDGDLGWVNETQGGESVKTLGLLDALSLLEEQRRMEWTTV